MAFSSWLEEAVRKRRANVVCSRNVMILRLHVLELPQELEPLLVHEEASRQTLCEQLDPLEVEP
jgi:hypothetical protein